MDIEVLELDTDVLAVQLSQQLIQRLNNHLVPAFEKADLVLDVGELVFNASGSIV